jgi:hypothetical protein
MAKRYYVSTIIGDGSDQSPFRPAIEDVARLAGIPIRASYEIASDPVTGLPLRNWAFVKLAATNHVAMAADVRVDALPDLTFDVQLSTLTNQQLIAIRNRLQARGIDVSQITSTRTFRFLIRLLGRLHNATFEEDNFDVSDF